MTPYENAIATQSFFCLSFWKTFKILSRENDYDNIADLLKLKLKHLEVFFKFIEVEP